MAIKFANVLSLIIKNLELFYKSLECFECHTAQIHRNPPSYRHPSNTSFSRDNIYITALLILLLAKRKTTNKNVIEFNRVFQGAANKIRVRP